MRKIMIEIKKDCCTLIDAKNGGYIKSYKKLQTAIKKAEEIAKDGEVVLKFI